MKKFKQFNHLSLSIIVILFSLIISGGCISLTKDPIIGTWNSTKFQSYRSELSHMSGLPPLIDQYTFNEDKTFIFNEYLSIDYPNGTPAFFFKIEDGIGTWEKTDDTNYKLSKKFKTLHYFVRRDHHQMINGIDYVTIGRWNDTYRVDISEILTLYSPENYFYFMKNPKLKYFKVN